MNESESTSDKPTSEKSTPLRCFTGAAISGGLGYGAYNLMNAIASNFAAHPLHSDNQIVMRFSIAIRTLVVGVATMGTGIFSIVCVGLIILGFQLGLQNLSKKESSS